MSNVFTRIRTGPDDSVIYLKFVKNLVHSILESFSMVHPQTLLLLSSIIFTLLFIAIQQRLITLASVT